MDNWRKLVSKVRNQLYLVSGIRCILLAASAYLFVATFVPDIYAGIAGLVALVFGIWRTGLYQNKKQTAIILIHRYSAETEFSLHLLEKEELNIAERMQLERIGARSAKFSHLKLYTPLRSYTVIVLAAAAVYLFYPQIKPSAAVTKSDVLKKVFSTKENPRKLPALASASVFIQPPAYSRLPARESADLNVSTLAGSRLRWNVAFDDAEKVAVKLANMRGEEVSFLKKAGSFEYADAVTGSGLYTIKAYYKDSLFYQSDFYKLEAVPDLPPQIEPASKELYQYHFLKDSKSIRISAKISDDFQVSQAFIVATVARGAGENVKFREIKFPLSPGQFKEATIQKTIDLKGLNFSPGDELYYYWAAADNRKPEANFTKSDTYFIVYKDTAQIEEAELATMAVNIMPEYFRSQRQIIIDTEKLLARQKKLSKQAFNSASNEIGYDQKLLRLRYGQYLGEEFETNIGGGAIPEEGGNIVDAFTHHSDGTGEGAAERATEPASEKHDHDHHDHGKPADGTDSKDPLAALMEQYTHSHDDAETNTFYEQSTRSLLKMALEQMWQSELHLRTYEPEKALPFENKALEYLKTAQQKARTYVKKSGYDPPPIKQNEKRLTGELKELAADFNTKKQYREKTTAQLAAEVLGFLDQTAIRKQQQAQLQLAGNALSERLLNAEPTKSATRLWQTIAALQKLAGGKTISNAEKQQLKTELYKYSNRALQTRSGYSSSKKLEDAFWKKMH
ncbi:DUF4175 domain-containing protein [Dyadobacter aurulentus]|uniref:DUF4175 domain-containing protein n=1 Tax=Dyadobacter sp. UC 10 TaxID=2605428 RepID=UPI0011F1E439|nr:DUF4175 domain-containing protein [Dyadobacter sp. UC 10]KAA0992491.1 DUF4175 domain-containing protein [Dyadobacter sp. UC 10]